MVEFALFDNFVEFVFSTMWLPTGNFGTKLAAKQDTNEAKRSDLMTGYFTGGGCWQATTERSDCMLN